MSFDVNAITLECIQGMAVIEEYDKWNFVKIIKLKCFDNDVEVKMFRSGNIFIDFQNHSGSICMYIDCGDDSRVKLELGRCLESSGMNVISGNIALQKHGFNIFISTPICFNENIIGPYSLKPGILLASHNKDNLYVEAKCEDEMLMVSQLAMIKTSNMNSIRFRFSEKLMGGYTDDGLIWTLIRQKQVSLDVIPRAIKLEQHYYWPRLGYI